METYLETRSGIFYEFLDPKPDQIKIEDIAFSLSNKARFSGHTQFYSVAEHSVAVALRLPQHLRLAGLLHDAAEAYLGDIPSPLKACLPDFRAIETINERTIFDKFNISLSAEDAVAVKHADLQALFTEAHYLLPSGGKGWSMFVGKELTLDKIKPLCLHPVDVYQLFMRAYKSLTE